MPGGDAVQHVGLEHRIVCHAGECDVVAGKDVGVVLQVVAHLLAAVVLKPWFQFCEYFVSRKLIGCAGIVVRERNVSRRRRSATASDNPTISAFM